MLPPGWSWPGRSVEPVIFYAPPAAFSEIKENSSGEYRTLRSALVFARLTQTWSWSLPLAPTCCAGVGGPWVSGTNVFDTAVTLNEPNVVSTGSPTVGRVFSRWATTVQAAM